MKSVFFILFFVFATFFMMSEVNAQITPEIALQIFQTLSDYPNKEINCMKACGKLCKESQPCNIMCIYYCQDLKNNKWK